ncbi:MAG: prepilin-type N-terminal cleavage/methylation domain-containing protein [Verrucomicrobia bacterium]|nr:prepilin-type N-terminal cleavage/methylation domain-containing protein [Verrucomicrobiota bacterium]
MNIFKSSKPGHGTKAFTLVEVTIAMSIAALSMGAIVNGYVISAQRAEWSAYSLAAHSLAMQRLEQTRATKWDPDGSPAVDELIGVNFPVSINTLDIPRSGTNIVYATNFTTITTISTAPQLRMVQVDCVWKFMSRGLFTNTVATYRSVD